MATVTVSCRIPNGLVMELRAKGEDSSRKVVLRGSNKSRVPGAPGVTENVDEEFVKEWLEKNKKLTFVKRGFVAIVKDAAEAEAVGKVTASEKTGLERLDPKILSCSRPNTRHSLP